MIVLMSAFLLLSAFSCGGGNKANSTSEQDEKTVVNVPQFDADSAYLYVKNQVDFGPRVPNTKEHVACGNYLASQLEAFGAQVTNQYADLIAYDGTLLKARNIIGSYKPESKKRIALFAHWDTRPWADNDPDEKNHKTPILGANDGASGVGALLEIAVTVAFSRRVNDRVAPSTQSNLSNPTAQFPPQAAPAFLFRQRFGSTPRSSQILANRSAL